MLRVVVDTNIYISAFTFGGVADKLLQEAQTGSFLLFVSPAILNEIEAVLMKKFDRQPDYVERVIKNILGFAQLVIPRQTLQVIERDPADDRILECALAAEAKVIVTGDKDLKQLGQYHGIAIISPRQFFDQYQMKETA